jgi:hypothetical protein
VAQARGRCMISGCRNKVVGYMYVCEHCREQWPELARPMREWPEWARYLASQAKAERRAEEDRIEKRYKVRGKDEYRTYSEYDTADLGLLPDFDEDEDADIDGRYPSEMGDGAIEMAWQLIADWRND